MEDQKNSERGSVATSRARRSRKDGARKAALQKIKEAKSTGKRVKYELQEVEDIYDEVDEYEYSKRVNERLDDDWIVDDGGGDYYEDGREIFDDENENQENIEIDPEDKKSGKNKRKVKMTRSKNIQSMFASMGTKRKVSDNNAALGNDELLGDILSEMSEVKDSVLNTPPPPVLMKKRPNGNFRPDPIRPSVPKKTLHAVPPPPTTAQNVAVTPPAKRLKTENIKTEEVTIASGNHFDTEAEEPAELKVEKEKDPMSDTDYGALDFSEDEMETKPKSLSNQLPDLSWGAIKHESMTQSPVAVSCSDLPLVQNEQGEKVLQFFWLDAHEDYYNNPGVCYLFGKVYLESAKTHVSCCVTVKNIKRCIYFLPRIKNKQTGEEVTAKDVYEEFIEMAGDYKIMTFKTKVVMKKNVFGEQYAPEDCEYVEIRYPFTDQPLPQDLSGNTFSHVFGTQAKSLELLLVEKNIMGPCWLDIQVPSKTQKNLSWCKVEASIPSMKNLTITSKQADPPPLTTLTLNMKTLPNLKTHQNEVLCVAGLVHYSFKMDKAAPKPVFQQHFCGISKPVDCVYPYNIRDAIKQSNIDVEISGSERALLTFLLVKIQKIDPDIIIGHGIQDFDLDVLLHRISQCKVMHWSRIGRLRRSNMPKLNSRGYKDAAVTCGRVLCDVKIMAKELIRCKNYDLATLMKDVLNAKRQELLTDQFKNMFSSSKQLIWLIEHTLTDANGTLNITCELNALPLAMQITKIAGNVLSRTLLGGRAERNEYLLLHAFYGQGYLLPEKFYNKKKQNANAGERGTEKRNKKAAYAGGLVLEPKKGFYDKYILLLDFNSLYPSIIQEYNICFTTLDRHSNAEGEDAEDFIPEIPEEGMKPGVLPTEIKKLVDRRKQVKQLMKGSNVSQEQMTQYDIRQKALKLTANSMYGCLGFSHSRFYAKPLAALITSMGRQILMHTKELAERLNLEVIYGDTDSIMINTNSCDLEQVHKIGNQVKAEVNKLYKLLEIDIDGVYKSMLLLKKKKYAALSVIKKPDGTLQTTQEMKGLDIVRRDWSELAKLAGSFCVSQILSCQPRETIVDNILCKMQELADKVQNSQFPLSVYQISKELTRDPSEYRQKVSLPHVLVALRSNTQMSHHYKSGDVVTYLICDDGTDNPATQRGYTVNELETNDKLKVDTNYYLSQQIHPVVMRLCDPITELDAAQIAERLGLDPTSYRRSMKHDDDEDDFQLMVQTNERERFAQCDSLVVKLPTSDEPIKLDSGVFAQTDSPWMNTLESMCQNGTTLSSIIPRLQNQITLAVRKHIIRYNQNWMSCDDNLCGHQTRSVPVDGLMTCPSCSKGHLKRVYTERQLHTQLSYYKLQFDVDYALKKYEQLSTNSPGNRCVQPYRNAYDSLVRSVNKYLDQSLYGNVSMSRIFAVTSGGR